AVRVLPSQNPPDSTPPADNPVADASPVARIIAVSGSSQPRTGDQRIPAGSPFGQVLRIEHRHRATTLPGAQGGGEIVGARAGGDHGAGGVEDGGDDDVQALTGAGRADQ